MFKKFKNKKSATPIKTNAMTEPTTPHNQNTLSTATTLSSDVADSDTLTPTHQADIHSNLAVTDQTSLQQPEQQTTPMTDAKKIPDTPQIAIPAESVDDEVTILDSTFATSDNSQTLTVTPAVKPAKIKLTGRMLNFTRLHIAGNDLEQIKHQLAQKFAHQPDSKMLIVLSCEEMLDLADLLAMLWEFGLQPIGIVTGVMDEQAREQKLAIFPADGKRINVLTEDKKSPALPATTLSTVTKLANPTDNINENNIDEPTDSVIAETPPTIYTQQTDETTHSYVSSLPQTSQLEGDLVYTTILRSGQSINHVGGDLILTQGINAGAEAITDYSLHVYGKAEGRLVAGATGDENAKIFCLRFNPSLVSVAGTFCLRENIPSEYLDKAVQVRFERDKGLIFTLMNG